MRRSYYTYNDIIIYLDANLRGLFETETIDGNRFPILENDIPIIEQVIIPEEDKLIEMGFSCVKAKKTALLPIIASFLQYSLIQRSNQQLNVPYSQITQSYHDALLFLEANKNMCGSVISKNNVFIKSSKRNIINAGF